MEEKADKTNSRHVKATGVGERFTGRKDLRVLKTDRSIRESFITLLGEKPYERVTVQDILDRAMINRKTFYNHYRDKDDLAVRMMDNLADQLIAGAERFRLDPTQEHFTTLCNALLGRRNEVLALWDVHTSVGGFRDRLFDLLVGFYKRLAMPTGQDPADTERQAVIYFNLATAQMHMVLQSGGEFTVPELMRDVQAVFRVLQSQTRLFEMTVPTAETATDTREKPE